MDLLWWKVFGLSLVAKTCLVLAVGLFVSWLTRRSTAQWRHLVLALASTLVLLLPLISLLVPQWQLAWIIRTSSSALAQTPTTSSVQLGNAGGQAWTWWLLGILTFSAKPWHNWLVACTGTTRWFGSLKGAR